MTVTTKRLIHQWKDWDNANPDFYPLFTKFCLEAAKKVKGHISVKLIWERIRWETDIEMTDPNTKFKMANAYHALYARKFMKDYPRYKGLFRTVPQKAVTQQELDLYL